MVGRATLTTVASRKAMLDPSTVAAITHRPCVLLSRMVPGAGETAATTLSILSPRPAGCPARAPAGAAAVLRHGLARPPGGGPPPVREDDPDLAAGERHGLPRVRGERGAAV